MINFYFALYVNSYLISGRDCGTAVIFTDSDFQFIDITSCNYLYTLAVIEGLKKVLQDELSEYEWGGGERAFFTSGKADTVVEDLIFDAAPLKISTEFLLRIMEEKRKQMEKWTKERIRKAVSWSFETIKQNPSNFVIETKVPRYLIDLPNEPEKVLLVVEEEDFGMTSEEYTSSLAFKDDFFPKNNMEE